MKKIVLLLVCVLALGIVKSFAYEPIVKEGKQWVYYMVRNFNEGGASIEYALPYVFYFEGDTTINMFSYKILHVDGYFPTYNPSSLEPVHHSNAIVAFAREDAGVGVKVYYKNSYIFPFLGRFMGYDILIYPPLDQSLDFIQGHFDRVGLTVNQRNRYGTFTGTDAIDINGTDRHVYNTSIDYIKLIEGIGFIQTNEDSLGPIANFLYLRDDTENEWIFSHLIEDGEIVYKGELYDYFAELDYFKNHEMGYSGVEAIDTASVQCDGAYYDMQGRRMAEPAQPGIYVRDGKKIVVK